MATLRDQRRGKDEKTRSVGKESMIGFPVVVAHIHHSRKDLAMSRHRHRSRSLPWVLQVWEVDQNRRDLCRRCKLHTIPHLIPTFPIVRTGRILEEKTMS
ncbi:hypothetical protein NECAME_13062 [Necator americanus]|uniref:Uncharacterized protein n=1 Tax=Necator americanus TaxID=51031 RepID=W2SXR7_NECAM|nr:hypothetical protein NECAME_13062 [Necator americanus]ETN74318.1 hypothetical protein NECAME_13062 [Necator americanus]